MEGQITVKGIVLSAAPIGESDRRVVLLTDKRAKISTFAKGARRPLNKLVSVTQPFVFGDCVLSEYRNSFTLIDIDAKERFTKLSSDIDLLYYGTYFCEFAGALTRENLEAKEELRTLCYALKALENGRMDKKLIRRAFELRMLAAFGEMPQLGQCCMCGKSEGLTYFSQTHDGMLCTECASRVASSTCIPVLTSTHYTLHHCVTEPLEKMFSFAVKPEVFEQFDRIVENYVGKHVGKKEFSSLEMIDLMDGL